MINCMLYKDGHEVTTHNVSCNIKIVNFNQIDGLVKNGWFKSVRAMEKHYKALYTELGDSKEVEEYTDLDDSTDVVYLTDLDDSTEVTQPPKDANTSLTNSEIRQKAKDAGIDNHANARISTLTEKLSNGS